MLDVSKKYTGYPMHSTSVVSKKLQSQQDAKWACTGVHNVSAMQAQTIVQSLSADLPGRYWQAWP